MALAQHQPNIVQVCCFCVVHAARSGGACSLLALIAVLFICYDALLDMLRAVSYRGPGQV
jgi:hypothetical protein